MTTKFLIMRKASRHLASRHESEEDFEDAHGAKDAGDDAVEGEEGHVECGGWVVGAVGVWCE